LLSVPIVCAIDCCVRLAGVAVGGESLLLLNPAQIGQLHSRIVPAVLLTLMFALIALRLRSVTLGGAIAGSLVSIAIYLGYSAGGFAALATVFVLTAVATRIGFSRKQRFGTAEDQKGRGAMQVLANLLVAAVLAVLGGVFEMAPWLSVLMVAALAEAAADTVSSECGQAWSQRVYLIINFRRVAVGTDGGISVAGTVAGICAGAIVAAVSYRLHILAFHSSVLAGTAGILGMFADSLLGATFERRRWLGNNGVNFLSTVTAAALAALFLS
jgi:uncharacterized protein (TIGR00297 family)